MSENPKGERKCTSRVQPWLQCAHLGQVTSPAAQEPPAPPTEHLQAAVWLSLGEQPPLSLLIPALKQPPEATPMPPAFLWEAFWRRFVLRRKRMKEKCPPGSLRRGGLQGRPAHLPVALRLWLGPPLLGGGSPYPGAHTLLLLINSLFNTKYIFLNLQCFLTLPALLASTRIVGS